MKTKDKITYVPPMRQDEYGWLNINGETLLITSVHSFDDFGVEQDTFTLEDGSEYFTQDGGSTFEEN